MVFTCTSEDSATRRCAAAAAHNAANTATHTRASPHASTTSCAALLAMGHVSVSRGVSAAVALSGRR